MSASLKDDSLRALIYTIRKTLDFSDMQTDDIIKIIELSLIDFIGKNKYYCVNEESVDEISNNIKNKLKTTKIHSKILLTLFIGWLISKNETCFECSDGKSRILLIPPIQNKSIVSIHISCKE